ncbi:MAG: SecY-interacting protein Syd [Pseudomonadota bacterium]
MTGTDTRPGLVPVAPVAEQLARVTSRLLDRWQSDTGGLPSAEHDPDWPSACIVGAPDNGRCFWRPVPMQPAVDLDRLGDALEVTLHPAWRTLFTVQWSAALPLRYNDGEFELLQLWNAEDADNLIANQIGHALEKRRVRQPLTLFFGLVDDHRLLSVDNDGGAVQLETLGSPGPEEVTPDLATFLSACEPAPPHPT